jgi:hypothetical protein
MTSSVPPVGRGAIVVLSRRTQALDWDAHREGRRYMVHSDELLSAFWSWRLCCGSAESQEDPIVSDHRYNFIHSNAEYGRNR